MLLTIGLVIGKVRSSSRFAHNWMNKIAEVAKLVDAHGSGPCGGNPVEVQVLSSAPRFIIGIKNAIPTPIAQAMDHYALKMKRLFDKI